MPESSPTTDGTQFGIVVGTSVARLITEQLGVRLNFPDRSGELQELSVMVESLPSIEVAEPELARVLQAEQTVAWNHAQEARLSEHESMLARGKVLSHNSASEQKQTYAWRDVAPEAKAGFADQLDDIRASLTGKPNEVPGEDPIVSEFTELELASLLHGLVAPLVGDLKDIIPLPRHHRSIVRLGKLAASAVGHPFGRAYDEFLRPNDRTKSLKEPTHASRTARELNKIVDALIDNPYSFLANLLIAEHREAMEQAAVEQLDERIIGLQVPLAAAPKLGKKALGRPHRHDKDEQKKTASEPVAVTSVTPTKTAELAPDEPTEVVETVGTFTLPMPWMPGGPAEVEVKQLTHSGQTVYIARALTPKLEGIALESRQKASTNAKGVNQYDATAIHMARSIALGVQPHRNSGLKRLWPKTLAKPYKGQTIWYPQDIGPNTPRLYFSVRKMGEFANTSEPGLDVFKKDNDCVVVLAETDKANQLDVLGILTIYKRGHHRNRGSGSI